MNKYDINVLEPIIKKAILSSKSMMEAASKTNLNIKTFFKYAKILGLFTPNQSGKGINKKMPKTSIEEILKGNYPNYHTYKLGKRLISENYKEHKCEKCNNTEWNNFPIPLELDHIDGNSYNHKLENLRLLCPNCHAQTPTYRSKNRKSLRK
jgi:Zn finger protein HypA/HybF involved in hydrogenase expression